MSFAVVIQVELDPEADGAHRHAVLRDVVIPEARALPGFLRGMWMHDGLGTGTCVVVFDSQDNARSALTALTPAGGPTVTSSAVCDVEIET